MPEDRCHLNGIAFEDDRPQYVTALGETDEPQGWRPGKAEGGIVIDYDSREVVCRGLAMPHSPRLYRDQLWVLNSGIGELQVVDPANGQLTTVCRLPGFLRGLTFYGDFAFVGSCLAREKKEFGGLPIESMFPELQCALHIVDIRSGQPVGFIEFTKGIEELFDVVVLPGIREPHMIGFEEETIDGLFVIPDS